MRSHLLEGLIVLRETIANTLYIPSENEKHTMWRLSYVAPLRPNRNLSSDR